MCDTHRHDAGQAKLTCPRDCPSCLGLSGARVPRIALQQREQSMGLDQPLGCRGRNRLGGRLLGGLASSRDVAAKITGVGERRERGHGKLIDMAATQRDEPPRVAERDLEIVVE